MFFQAEDGIRDLVRSRGLGDVYKRQAPNRAVLMQRARDFDVARIAERYLQVLMPQGLAPVSYTHLTLPTSDLV